MRYLESLCQKVLYVWLFLLFRPSRDQTVLEISLKKINKKSTLKFWKIIENSYSSIIMIVVYSCLRVDFSSQTAFLFFKCCQHSYLIWTNITCLEQLEDNFRYNFNFFGILKLIYNLRCLFFPSGEDKTCLHSWIRPWETSEFLSGIIKVSTFQKIIVEISWRKCHLVLCKLILSFK